MLNLRPHHLLCIQSYIGHGYSEEFVENMDKIVLHLNDDTSIKLVKTTDDICKACPNNLGNGKCQYESKVCKFDAGVLTTFNFKDNYVYSYKFLLGTLKEKLTQENFKNICGNCEWYSHGYCSTIYENLKK
ncbi:MAG: hypothetical protein K0R54_1070 [Clostridiaceae bacterium]|jgi:hypothetical protein|nr:hypothetical protein [Clostridiaceae bacterium]